MWVEAEEAELHPSVLSILMTGPRNTRTSVLSLPLERNTCSVSYFVHTLRGEKAPVFVSTGVDRRGLKHLILLLATVGEEAGCSEAILRYLSNRTRKLSQTSGAN